MPKRKPPATGPKNTSKLKGGLKAYWDKKNAAAKKAASTKKTAKK